MIHAGTILVVDDTHASLKLITDILVAEGYQVRPADSGELALASVAALPPELILLDILMPGIDGFEVLRRLKAREETCDIPVIVLSALTEVAQRVEALNLGAVDFISKPFQPDELLARVRTHRELFRLRARLEQQAAELRLANEQLQSDIAQRKQAEAALQESHAKLEKNLKGAIDVIAGTIEAKGSYPPGHHRHVATLTSAIAREMGLTDFQVQGIELTAAVYDIGLMTIPIEFIQDNERLDGIKLTLYQGYPQAGHDALKKIEFPWPIAEIILQHRECFDGSGFPQGIKGEGILIEARILALAAALEDLTTHKSFRNALPLSEALDKISSESGYKYDPEVVAACLRVFREKGYQIEGTCD
jgi:putative two-component system response regulator